MAKNSELGRGPEICITIAHPTTPSAAALCRPFRNDIGSHDIDRPGWFIDLTPAPLVAGRRTTTSLARGSPLKVCFLLPRAVDIMNFMCEIIVLLFFFVTGGKERHDEVLMHIVGCFRTFETTLALS